MKIAGRGEFDLILLLGFNGFIYNALIGEFQIFVYVNRIIRKIGTFLSSGISVKSSAPAPVRLRRYGYLLWRPSSNLGDLTANFGK